jgi:Glyoxalase/Bleomycin resistance protein/Dioxygenase superfamily
MRRPLPLAARPDTAVQKNSRYQAESGNAQKNAWPDTQCCGLKSRRPWADPALPTVGRMRIDRLDHLVLTVTDLDATVAFYSHVLGMKAVTFGGGRTALVFGNTKINLHQAGHEFDPKATVQHPAAPTCA